MQDRMRQIMSMINPGCSVICFFFVLVALEPPFQYFYYEMIVNNFILNKCPLNRIKIDRITHCIKIALRLH